MRFRSPWAGAMVGGVDVGALVCAERRGAPLKWFELVDAMVHQLKTVLPDEFILSEPFHGVGTFYYICREAEQAFRGSVHVSLVNAYEFDKRFLKFYKERDAKDSCNPRQVCLSSMEDFTKFPMHVRGQRLLSCWSAVPVRRQQR